MKIALVTGAYKGLGFEFCKQLSKQGYKVILTARDLKKAQKAAELLNEQELNVYPKALEVTNEKQIQEIASWTKEVFGKIDLIVNNAGINPKDYADKIKMAKAFYLNELDAKEMLDVLHVNSIAPLLVVKHFRQLLCRSEKPIVINISSWLGSVTNLTFGGHYGYIGSKNLLNVLNKSMANELKAEQIICVNVNPGWVQTDMGGAKAQFTTVASVTNMINNILSKVEISDSGNFLNYDGKVHPW
ncbi:MAG: SDR family oxidoreductase [Bacteroidia bacterium]|nr:SDR family oxidoreductase [Bacteroidia bacterium]